MDFIVFIVILIVLSTIIIIKNKNTDPKPEQQSNFVKQSRTNHVYYKV